MSKEENKTTVLKAFEAVNQQDLAAMDELMASDFYSHSVPPGMPPTRESHKQALSSLFSAFPDYHVTVEDMVAEADKVVARLTVRGTHRGNLFGAIPPTGKQVAWKAVDIFRLADGKIVEYWLVADNLELLQQLQAQPTRE
jgi:steroid delta-isomerase-like uncharacterized protein